MEAAAIALTCLTHDVPFLAVKDISNNELLRTTDHLFETETTGQLGRRAAALKAVGYKGDVVIESFTTDVKVIARAAAIWRQMEPTRDEIAVKGLKFLKKTLK